MEGSIAGACRDFNGVIVDGFAKTCRASSTIGVETLALAKEGNRRWRVTAYHLFSLLMESLKARGIYWPARGIYWPG